MSSGPVPGTAGWLRWTYRTWEPLQQTQQLIVRGMRPQIVTEITGIPHGICKELRRELLPDGPDIRGTIPSGMESRALRTEKMHRAGSVFVAVYLNAIGAQAAARDLHVEAWCVAFDASQEVCERLGWEPMQADYGYIVAREFTNPEARVYDWCKSCGAIYYRGCWNSNQCPFCRELSSSAARRGRRAAGKEAPACTQ